MGFYSAGYVTIICLNVQMTPPLVSGSPFKLPPQTRPRVGAPPCFLVQCI